MYISRSKPIEVSSLADLFAISEQTELAFVKINPTVADAILSQHNNKNRPLSKSTIIKYTTEMKDNRWIDGVTAISFNDKKELSDGQHRLYAMKESDTSQVFMVNFNQPEEAFQVIDSGKKRTPSDVLALEGYKNKATLSAMVRKYNHYLTKKGNMWNISTPCNSQQTLALVKAIPELAQIAQYIDGQKLIQYIGNKSDIATAYLILKLIDSEKADIFIKDFLITEQATTYNGIDYRSLIVGTRQKLLENKNLKGKIFQGRKSDPHDGESRTYWYIFDAWNKFISGDTKLPSFKVSRSNDESFPRVQSLFTKKVNA